jgi:hypothetical protein
MPELDPKLAQSAGNLSSDTWRNIELLLEDEAGDPAQASLVRWAAYVSTLALEVFDAIVVLLNAGKTRAAFILARSLIDYHVRLRYYVVQAREVEHVPEKMAAVRDWSSTELESTLPLYEPDEWPDEGMQRIFDTLGADSPPRKRAFIDMCAYLEEHEKKENEYRWAQAAWLVEGTLARGERAVAADVLNGASAVHRESPTATSRSVLFEAMWYVLDIVDTIGMIRGWAFGAVKARQDAIKLYLATKPEESSSSSTGSE